MVDAQSNDERSEQRGLHCRQCGGTRFRVIYTRPACGGKIVRRRECRRCLGRILTWEKPVGGD